jgi:hypothetical protein
LTGPRWIRSLTTDIAEVLVMRLMRRVVQAGGMGDDPVLET